MRNFKRLITSILLVCTLLITGVIAAGAASGSASKDTFFSEEDILNAWGTFTKAEQDDYSGVYVNDDGAVVILFKEDSASLQNAIEKNKINNGILKYETKSLEQPLVIKAATFSYQDLKNVNNLMTEKGYSYDGVYSVSLNNETNCIDIGVKLSTDIDKLKSELVTLIGNNIKEISGPAENIISLHYVNDDDLLQYSTSVNGNSQLNTTIGSSTYYYSAAVKYYSNTYGNGFLTTGHAPRVNDPVKLGSTTVGYVKTVHHDGLDDTAFVQFSSGNSWESITTLYEEKVSVVPAQGVTIKVRGYQTTPYESTEVLSNTYSYYNSQDGITWTDMIEVDYGVTSGDSGGAAYYGTIDGGRTTRVIGVISAASSSITVIVKAGNINHN